MITHAVIYIIIFCVTVTVGTQAAVLAGLDVTMFIEFQPPPNSEWVSLTVKLCPLPSLEVTIIATFNILLT
jgi:hypothetical protein